MLSCHNEVAIMKALYHDEDCMICQLQIADYEICMHVLCSQLCPYDQGVNVQGHFIMLLHKIMIPALSDRTGQKLLEGMAFKKQ